MLKIYLLAGEKVQKHCFDTHFGLTLSTAKHLHAAAALNTNAIKF